MEHDGYIHVDGARLFYREVGSGAVLVVLHGGPDFNHGYLLPEMDRLADAIRLVYYDQRGRGRSAEGVKVEDVSLESEMADLDCIRRRLGLETVGLLGHSFGGVLAMEYAARHPEHVSHLLLVNTAPASASDAERFRRHLVEARPLRDLARMQELRESAAYAAGALESELEYYRLHFRGALRRPEHLELVLGRLRRDFTEETTVTARAIEQRLYEETWAVEGYDLVPKLEALDVPTLVLHGAHDFVPVPLAARIARSMRNARLVVLEECGHFSYLEQPDAFHESVVAFFVGS